MMSPAYSEPWECLVCGREYEATDPEAWLYEDSSVCMECYKELGPHGKSMVQVAIVAAIKEALNKPR